MKSLKSFISLVLISAGFQFSADAQAIDPTSPVPGDPLTDYRIVSCEGTRGFGWLRYDPSGKIGLSDLCLN